MSPATDKRLFSVRNFVASNQKSKGKPNIYEFEVFVEVPVQGEFRNGPFMLVPWDTDDGPVGLQRSLVLTIESYLADIVPAGTAPSNAISKGFYHVLTLPEEICALATTLLRRRVTLGALLRANGMPLRVRPQLPRRHDAIIADLDLDELSPSMAQVFGLPVDYHQMFILACRMYQESLSLIDAKPDLAYLLLVSCIEVFVGRLGRRTKETDLAPTLRDALAKCDEGSRAVILEAYLAQDRGVGRNFVEFILEHVGDEFWAASPKITVDKGLIERVELPALLTRIYDARSKLVHEAEPFPPNVLDAPDDKSEIDRRSELTVGEKRWSQKQIIPYARFFERLVQHVLTAFLKKHTSVQATV